MPTSPQVLVVFADAALHRSRLSRRIGNLTRSLAGIEVRDLYELYPDFYVDVRSERALVQEARMLLFAFQLGWYGMPSLLKEWFDTVLPSDWALANGGSCLRGKRCWAIVDSSEPASDFQPGSRHARPIADYLLPLEQTARACGMTWLEPHFYYDSARAGADAVDAHALALRGMVERRLHELTGMEEGHGR